LTMTKSMPMIMSMNNAFLPPTLSNHENHTKTNYFIRKVRKEE
jgi:hypothetical protein